LPRTAIKGAFMQKPSLQLYSELQYAFDLFNQSLFAAKLPECMILLYNKEYRVCGYFSPNRFTNPDGKVCDAIALNPQYFATTNIVQVMQTVVHEMCHMWQHHFGEKKGQRAYHNKEWGDKMESLGLMPSSTGQPGGKKTGQKMNDYPIEGGLFLEVCERLITPEYSLSWRDRQIELSLLPLPVVGTEPVKPAGHGNKSNRIKYTCPGCGVNVWGKPDLQIVCVHCGQTFF